MGLKVFQSCYLRKDFGDSYHTFFRWGDWHCNSIQDGPNNQQYLFKPLCQKDKGTEISTDILPDILKCVDNDVKYKSEEIDKLEKIQNVESAEICRKKCSETNRCLYWTWINKKNKKVCKLKSGVLNTGFRRQKNGAVSGTMLNECRLEDQSE